MSAISITASNVVPVGTSYASESGVAGVAIAAGEWVYKDASTNQYGLLDCDSATAGVRVPKGIALNSAAAGQPVKVMTEGDVDIGAVVTKGLVYVAGATAGKMNPSADLTTGWYVSTLAIALSTSRIRVKISESGIAT